MEIIGFDNIEISMQLLQERQDAVQELSLYLNGDQQSAPVNGIGKGKKRDESK